MKFLDDNRPPREWCRSVPGTGFLHEEGYGSAVLYRKGTNPPPWLQTQADAFSRIVRHLDERANSGDGPDVYATTRQDYRDAADLVTQPRGAESNLSGYFGGRFGRGGPGSHAHDVLELLRRYIRQPDNNSIVEDYVATLNPEITPFDITSTSRGPRSQTTHQWFEILTPAYNLLISDFNAYARSSGANPSVLVKLQRIRELMDLPDGVRLPGRVRSLRGEPGIPPIDLRDWLTGENERPPQPHGRAPAFYASAAAYSKVVV